MEKNNIFLKIFLLVIFIAFVSVISSKALGIVIIQEKEKETSQEKEVKIEEKKKDKEEKKPEVFHYEITITATRTEKDTFDIPNPTSVLSKEEIIKEAPNNITELFFELPGVDVNGVGANQSRPVIRGLRGQRILLLEDGLRMNNSRRQQDFGEIPAMVDISGVERVEVVRGPASVLYGSDAIGGVVNIITHVPYYGFEGSEIHGNFGYRFSSAGNQNKADANLNGHLGNLGFIFNTTYRNTDDYKAPAGIFGNIELANDTIVHDTGVQDHSVNFFIGYMFSDNHDLSLKYEYYKSNDAGFGYVNPNEYNPGSTRIQILYPFQEVDKCTLRYQNRSLIFSLADSAVITGYYLKNSRQLDMNIFVPFGVPGLPNAGIDMQQTNFTDVRTYGFRLEFIKAYYKQHLFTYGMDYFSDNSQNTDSNKTQIIGFGPSAPVLDITPQLPNAIYRSLGMFLQDDIILSSRASIILGLRYQDVNARTGETPGLEGDPLVNSSDRTFVGSANIIYGLTEKLKIFTSFGRGFRSPNLIERFFDGTTPEGSGYQSRNLDLKAETSFNIDLGLKYRDKNIYFETIFFNNTVYDGIRISPTGDIINGVPEYRNVNIDKLRMKGVEILGDLRLKYGFSLGANFTHLTSKDLANPNIPYVDTFSSKLNFHIRYDNPKDIFWLHYNIRCNGDQKDVDLGNNPIGSIIPGFTVHNLRGGVTLFKNSMYSQRLGIVVGNLSNTLYSEFSNASFFRPAPRRHIVITWSINF